MYNYILHLELPDGDLKCICFVLKIYSAEYFGIE